MPDEHDTQVRMAAFQFLEEQSNIFGDRLPRDILSQGFIFRDKRIPLISPKGIFKPAIMDLPLTITTVPPSPRKPKPYEDSFNEEGYLNYCYRGENPNHPDNKKLRECMNKKIPLIYFIGLVPGLYYPSWPVYIIGDNPKNLIFTVAMDDSQAIEVPEFQVNEGDEARRQYITASVKKRLHQKGFRERVLWAYKTRCAICRLKHQELLDAAHILPDKHPQGAPEIYNGLALCKLHHAAYDSNFMGIRPDLTIELRKDLLEEKDGPMLLNGLQGFQNAPLNVPKAKDLRPKPEFLEERYGAFLAST